VSALHEKASKIVVAVLRDAKLWVARSTLSLPRSEAEKGTDLTTGSEARGIGDGQNIRQGRERANTRNAAEQSPFTTERCYTLAAGCLLRYKTPPPSQIFFLVLSHTVRIMRQTAIHKMWFA